jgi:DnaK suppressor protein
MSTLTQQQRHHIEKLLKDRQQILTEEIHADARRVREEGAGAMAADVPDSGDVAAYDHQSDVDIQALNRDVSELREIESALARLNKPDFGLCMDCSQPIGFNRLNANPTTQRCVDCQGLYERTFVPRPSHTL